MAGRLPPWLIPIIAPAIAGAAAYYGSQVTLEHRLTMLEIGAVDHRDRDGEAWAEYREAIHNVWFAISKNHEMDGKP